MSCGDKLWWRDYPPPSNTVPECTNDNCKGISAKEQMLYTMQLKIQEERRP